MPTAKLPNGHRPRITRRSRTRLSLSDLWLFGKCLTAGLMKKPADFIA
jgi:hypothetical protein